MYSTGSTSSRGCYFDVSGRKLICREGNLKGSYTYKGPPSDAYQ